MDAMGRRKILLVEDDKTVSHPLRTRLESVGFEIHIEECGKTGLAYATNYWPDLVILDIRLPDMDGYEVCKQLRRLCNPWVIPILMLTAMAQPIDQLRGFAHGANAYLTKPYSPKELLKTVSLLLGEVTPEVKAGNGRHGGNPSSVH